METQMLFINVSESNVGLASSCLKLAFMCYVNLDSYNTWETTASS